MNGWRVALRLAVFLPLVAKSSLATAVPLVRVSPLVYKVEAVHGMVFARSPHAVRWSRVAAGGRLLEGELIQVETGAAVTLRADGRPLRAGLAAGDLELTLTKPVIARLAPDMLREVSLTPYFIQKTREHPPDGTDPVLPRDFREAWNRLAAVVFDRPAAQSSANLDELDREGIALGLGAKPLEMVAPATGSILKAEAWPSEVKVVWIHPPSLHPRYFVYVWPRGAARGAPIAETERDFQTVSLPRAGIYFVQVTTTDGTHQSRGHVIYAMEAPRLADLSGGRRDGDIKRSVVLQAPPDHFVVASPMEARVTFAWTLAGSASGEKNAMLMLRDAHGKALRSWLIKESQMDLALAPGRYVWGVASEGDGGPAAWRSIEVLAPSLSATGAKRRRLVREALTGLGDVVLSLDEGL